MLLTMSERAGPAAGYEMPSSVILRPITMPVAGCE
jgi:hypothetical protein